VHPNTVRYRLRRAAELFHLDLDDPDEVLTLWLALRTRPTRRTAQRSTVTSTRWNSFTSE
jgi:DNA-binding PucR family transcriptional regulator